MTVSHPLLRNFLCALSVLLLSSGSLAQEIDNRANVYGGFSIYNFNENWDLKNDGGWLIGGEFPAFGNWTGTIEHWDFDPNYEPGPGDATVDYTRVGANYLLPMQGDWQPYIGLGIGNNDYKIDIPGLSDSSTAMDIGAGIKRFFGEHFFLRGDAKLIKVNGIKNNDLAFNLSWGYAFGGSKSPSMPAAPARPVVEEPQQAMAEPDSDGDGVIDRRDRCPGTPMELAVDDDGCPILDSSMMRQELMVNFDFDKSIIKPQYDQEIADFAQFMQTYANTNVVIEGHTDSDGTEAYNQGLSERRANAVMNRLIERYGIPASRLSAVGYGETRPLVPNDSEANKARNRRIMGAISVEIQQQRRR